MPCRVTGQGHVVTDTFSLEFISVRHIWGVPYNVHRPARLKARPAWFHVARSTLLTAERTIAYTLQNSTFNFRFHWSQRAYSGSERNNHKREIKKRYNNSSMVTACLGHYRTSEHSRTYTGYFYFNCHYLNYNLSRKPNTARLKQWSGSSEQPFSKDIVLRSSMS